VRLTLVEEHDMTRTFSANLIRAFVAAAILISIASGCAGTPVRESTGEFIDDSAITTRIKTALLERKSVSGTDISVETFKGTVQLGGFVNSADEKQRAEDLARSVGGVKSVVNGIEVK
jgi:hyperosmotically inducible periplasmic protein